VREIYDSENSHECFEKQLDRLLEAGVRYIVIEPGRLGDETSRWLSVGGWLHRTAVNVGLVSLIAGNISLELNSTDSNVKMKSSGVLWPDRPVVCVPLASVSALAVGLYTLSWHPDPCCQYQVERDSRALAELTRRYPSVNSAPTTILVRREALRTQRHLIHWSVALVAAAFSSFRLYKAHCC
jgi:Mitochondrial morphogenesis regulator